MPACGLKQSSDRRRFWIGAAAASLFALAIGAGVLLYDLRGQVIATERGERREMALQDGSVLKVDAETRIRIRFRERERRIFLDQGRVLFRVAKAPNRPFLVYADETVVRAVGTEFGVERQRRGVVVTVAEGQVGVGAAGLAAADATGSGPDADQAGRSAAGDSAGSPRRGSAAGEIFLAANQQLTVLGSGTDLIRRAVDSSRALAWAEGRLVFENDTIAAVISQFNRYNLVQLRVTDPVLAGRQVSGVFDATDSESFVAFLQTLAMVRVMRDEPQVVTIAPAQ
jgi:transmembrane sensor